MSSLHFYASELLQKWHNCVVFLQQQARDAIEGGRRLRATFAAKISFSGFQAAAARSFRSTFMSTAAPGSGEWLPEVVERYGVSTERSSRVRRLSREALLLTEWPVAFGERLLETLLAAGLHPILHSFRLMGDTVEVGRRLLERPEPEHVEITVDCGLMQCQQFERDHRDAPGIRERFRLELFPRVDAVYEMPLERLARPHQVAREEIFFRLARAHQDWPHR